MLYICDIKQINIFMYNKSLQGALDRKLVSNNIETHHYDLPMDEFLCHISEYCTPNKYGSLFPKKVCYDSKGIVEIQAQVERGDCLIGASKYAELKISYINKSGSYSIRNIRGWQKFDYFILCFVDAEFNARFYCVDKEVITNNGAVKLSYQNGTAESNANNNRVGMGTTIKHEDLSWHFKKTNLLEGTSYKHLLKFIDKLCDNTQEESPVGRIYRQASTLSYNYDGKIIRGRTNKESMWNLVKAIGPKKLDGIVWKSQLGKVMKPCHEYMGDGYYFNPKFSLRDTETTIRMINEKTNFNVQLIKE